VKPGVERHVTLRERDSMKQTRVPIADLQKLLFSYLG